MPGYALREEQEKKEKKEISKTKEIPNRLNIDELKISFHKEE